MNTDQTGSSKLAIIVQQGKVLDFIDGKTQRPETPEEYVRQEIAKSLAREYRYEKPDAEVEKSNLPSALVHGSRADLVIFPPTTPHTHDKALIIVECKSSTVKAADKKDGFMWAQWPPRRSESHSGIRLRARGNGHAPCEWAQVPAGTLGSRRIACFILALTLMAANAVAQANSAAQQPTAPNENDALKVNWLYGAFVPRSVPMKPLTPRERWKLYLRTTYTTYGIYIKTGVFTLSDQIRNVPPEWGKTFGGFGKRLGTREAQFVIQNSLTAAGNAALDWEPRYDRCRCAGFWPRTWHSINRNFVTYGGPNQSTRPQIMPYVGAFGAAAASASWQPNNPSILVKGYQGAVTQVAVGIGVNWLAEFAPEIKRVLRRPPGPD